MYQKIGDYIIYDESFAQGSQGTLHDCYYSLSQNNIQLCAKKFSQPNLTISQYISKEMEILKLLMKFNTKNLVKVYDIIEQGQFVYVIMEKCLESDLHNFIEEIKNQKNNSKISATKALDFIYQFANGYKLLYDNNIIHRDIKPHNILLSKDSNDQLIYKISDYGIGKIVNDPTEQLNKTIIGTPNYQPPQTRCLEDYSSKFDIYSFGITLYYFIFKELPFINSYDFIKNLEKNKSNYSQFSNIGTKEQFQELSFILNNSIVYDENQRLSWIQLFNRLQSNKIYDNFRRNDDNLRYINVNMYQQIQNVQYYQQQQQSTNLNKELQNYFNIQIEKIQFLKSIIKNLTYSLAKQYNLFSIEEHFKIFFTAIVLYKHTIILNLLGILYQQYDSLDQFVQIELNKQQFYELISNSYLSQQSDYSQVIQDEVNYFKKQSVQQILLEQEQQLEQSQEFFHQQMYLYLLKYQNKQISKQIQCTTYQILMQIYQNQIQSSQTQLLNIFYNNKNNTLQSEIIILLALLNQIQNLENLQYSQKNFYVNQQFHLMYKMDEQQAKQRLINP